MSDSLSFLTEVYPNHIWVQISDEDLKQAESTAQTYSNQTGKYQAYLNYLCLNKFLKWVKENLGLEINFQKNCEQDNLLNLWEFLNGSTVSINSKRLILIPSETLDIESFEVEQEWVDLPHLAGEYYLPVQINLEEKYIHFWGFISQKRLKEKAEYDCIYKIYSVSGDWLIEDLNLLCITQDLSKNNKQPTIVLPDLIESEAKSFIETLSQPSPYSPRLVLQLEQWGALLKNNNWLQELYLQRLLNSKNRPLLIWIDRSEKQFSLPKNTETSLQKTSGYRGSFLQKESFKEATKITLDDPEKIRQAIQELLGHQKQEIPPPSLSDEDTLLYLLMKSHKNFSGEAAEIFWALAEISSPTATRRVISVEMAIGENPIILKIAIVQTPSQKVVLLLRVYSNGEQIYLPPGLRLLGVTEKGHPIPKLEAIARSEPLDVYIQLYFTADVGDRFGCCVTLDNRSITEYFLI